MKQSFFLFGLVILLISCSSDDQITQDALTRTSSWSKSAFLTENLRLGAPIIIQNNTPYLMPGKGAGRFSLVPEILRFDNQEWTQVSTYKGHAVAGNAAVWSHKEFIINIGGLNGSGAPTDQIVAYQPNTDSYQPIAMFPNGFLSTSGFTQTDTKGYVAFSKGSFNQPLEVNTIMEFDLESSSWKMIDLPVQVINAVSQSVMTAVNNEVYLLLPTMKGQNFFKLDTQTQQWTTLAPFPGEIRNGVIIASNPNGIYTGMGKAIDTSEKVFEDLWKYSIATNRWLPFKDYPGKPFHSGFAFVQNNILHIGGGSTKFVIDGEALNDEVYKIRLK